MVEAAEEEVAVVVAEAVVVEDPAVVQRVHELPLRLGELLQLIKLGIQVL